MTATKPEREKVADLVRDAGGKIVGRTKLQKIAYLLELTGQGDGFDFEYRHYGPYSEALADAACVANVFGLVEEEEKIAEWGGRYSTYKIKDFDSHPHADNQRTKFASAAAKINSVELELAATAAYLSAVEENPDPWGETAKRKPEKATGQHLALAKTAYKELMALPTPKPLPNI